MATISATRYTGNNLFLRVAYRLNSKGDYQLFFSNGNLLAIRDGHDVIRDWSLIMGRGGGGLQNGRGKCEVIPPEKGRGAENSFGVVFTL